MKLWECEAQIELLYRTTLIEADTQAEAERILRERTMHNAASTGLPFRINASKVTEVAAPLCRKCGGALLCYQEGDLCNACISDKAGGPS